MLDLVTAHRHLVRIEHDDVGGHQHRIRKQPHGDAVVGLDALGHVLVNRRLVGMRPVHQPLGRHAGQQPGELGDFGDVRLAVERDALVVQAHRQPGGGDFQARTRDPRRIVALDQRVVIRQEEECVHAGLRAGLDRWTDRARVVAKVGSSSGGDAGKDAGIHGAKRRLLGETSSVTCRRRGAAGRPPRPR
ncbi:hypothetical protein D3C72_1482640 [compost metagenome]